MREPCEARPEAFSRREFCLVTGALFFCAAATRQGLSQGATGVHFNVAEWDRARILTAADRALTEQPAPLTTMSAAHSKAGPRTFYAEAADWWPDDAASGSDSDIATQRDGKATQRDGKATQRDGKATQRDGYTNPNAYLTHANALVHLHEQMGALVAAFRLSGQERYTQAAWKLVRAWFLDSATAMEPAFDQAGVVAQEGRPEGIQDAMPLPGIVRASAFLCASPEAKPEDVQAWRDWCARLLQWLTDSRLGGLARDRTDINAICWTALAAELARFTRNDAVSRDCTHRFRDKLLRQMNFDGAFPEALARQRPLGRSLFTLECLSLASESLSTPFDNLWRYTLPDGRGMHSAIAFHLPSMSDKNKWPYPADVQHFAELPMRGGALLLAGRNLDRPEYIDVWKRLRPDPTSAEIARETPVRWPSLWATRPPA